MQYVPFGKNNKQDYYYQIENIFKINNKSFH